MNAEIYYLCQRKKDSDVFSQRLPYLIDEVRCRDISILYRTDMDYSHKSIVRAFKHTKNSTDDIKAVFILNGLGKTDNSPAIRAYEKITQKYKKNADFLENSDTDLGIYSLGNMGNGYHGCFTVIDGTILIMLPKSEFTGVSDINMMRLAVNRLFDSSLIKNKDTRNISHNGYEYYLYKKSRVSLFSLKYYFPAKGDSLGEVTRKVLIILCAVTMCISIYNIVNARLLEPLKVENTYENVKGMYYGFTDTEHKKETSPGKTDSETDGDISPAFKSLIAANDDVQGWIYVPGTEYIDYPVMQNKSDNADYQKYLYMDFNGNYSNYGSIFIDYRSDVKSQNIILHGHNTGVPMMFSELCNYKKLDFYKSSPRITFTTRNESSDYIVFAAFITNTLPEHGAYFDYLRGNFSSNLEFLNYIYQCRTRSLINTPVTVNEDDTILTMSTCTYEYEDFRMVVMARKVRENEKTDGFLFKTNSAYYNPNPLYPDIWYKDKGGTPCKVSTFEKIYSTAGFSWYDGDIVIEESSESNTDSENNANTAPTPTLPESQDYDYTEDIPYQTEENTSYDDANENSNSDAISIFDDTQSDITASDTFSDTVNTDTSEKVDNSSDSTDTQNTDEISSEQDSSTDTAS